MAEATVWHEGVPVHEKVIVEGCVSSTYVANLNAVIHLLPTPCLNPYNKIERSYFGTPDGIFADVFQCIV